VVGWFGFTQARHWRPGTLATSASWDAFGAAAAAISWSAAEWIRNGQLRTGSDFRGGAGLVAITPASGFVTRWRVVDWFVCRRRCLSMVVKVKNWFGYEIAGCSWRTRMGGRVGAHADRVFANSAINPYLWRGQGERGFPLEGNWRQLSTQQIVWELRGTIDVARLFILFIVDKNDWLG